MNDKEKPEIDALKEEIELCHKKLEGLDELIDALKAELHGMEELYRKKVDDCAEMEVSMHRQIEKIKAENKKLCEVKLAAAPTPPAQDEATIYQVRLVGETGNKGPWTDADKEMYEQCDWSGWERRALYTRPQSDKLRKASGSGPSSR